MTTLHSKNSNKQSDPEEIIRKVIALIDPEVLQCRIDEPIDFARLEFEVPTRDPMTRQIFHDAISGFVLHLHRDALRPSITLTPNQALELAIQYLERYENYKEGYTHALLEGMRDPPTGLESVFSYLADRIKLEAREKYLKWVYVTRLELLDWRTRLAVSKELHSHLAPEMTMESDAFLKNASPDDDLPDLIEQCRKSYGTDFCQEIPPSADGN